MIQTTTTSQGLIVKTPAKVNLTLRVLGRRDDGYHELESVVAAIDLYDTLEFREGEGLAFSCQGLDSPAGDENLVVRAARLLANECTVARGARITLHKQIPAGRGFGGGSSDAAATLEGLNAFWGCGLSTGDLRDLGARLGSDVPLFFSSPVSVMRGRGEEIEPVGAESAWWLALGWPDYGLPTAEVYAAYDSLPAADGRRPAATDILPRLSCPCSHAQGLVINDLEAAADVVRAGRLDMRELLRAAGAHVFGMTGSGSAWFAIADTADEAGSLADRIGYCGANSRVAALLTNTDRRKECMT